jgi:alpha-D-ribose 1-methylphosphonate 5-triphosphate synthase subunit PhnG
MDPSLPTSRQNWMRTLALAPWKDLAELARPYLKTEHRLLRPPETGLVMLQGRMGGSGSPFNVGEATVTRCSVALPAKIEGHAYVMGRNSDHAKLAAVCDALLQVPALHDEVQATVIQPLEQAIKTRSLKKRSKAGATKVDFFTLVRGDD